MVNNRKIVYIAGYGRSGSTILNILLLQPEGVVGVGELVNIFQSGWTVNRNCSCGEKTSDCPFWSRVKTAWEKDANYSIQEYAAVQKKYRRIFAMPYLFWLNIFPDERFKKFKHDTALLYESIFKISECRVIVDSSKDVSWLYLMKKMGLNPSVIHLVRDGRSVLRSMRKQWRKGIKPKSAFSIAFSWISNNALVEIFKKNTKNIFIKYEDLISAPEQVLDKIDDAFDIGLDDVKTAIATGKPLSKKHLISGNPIRLEKDLIFQQDKGLKNNITLSKRELLIFKITGYFWLKKYKYI
ncbi:MAG: sulfotransferase [Parafilimonas sp.]